MSEFTYLFRNGAPASSPASPEQMQQTMQKWMAWFKDLSTKGHLKEMGHPLEPTGKTVTGKSVTDGPFAEAKDLVGGFTIVQAKDLAEAAEIAKGCPILEVGGSVEQRPIQKMNM
jgi:hypothetical protein